MEPENQMIRTLLAVPPPSAHTTTAARRRLTDAIAGRRPTRRRTPSWRLSLAGSGLAAVAAAGVALAMAAGTGGPAGLGVTGSGGAPGVAAPPAGPQADAGAPQLLLAAAERADSTAGTGRYWRVARITQGALYLPVHAEGETFFVSERRLTETWTPRDHREPAWEGRQSLGFRPRTAEDVAAWKRAGSPRTFDLGPADSAGGGHVIRRMGPGKAELTRTTGDYASTYGPLALADLPTDAAKLRAAVDTLIEKRGAEATDPAVFALLGTLLTDAPAQPKLRAAAFTVLSTLSGVMNAGSRADVTGRTGVALELKQAVKQPGGGTFVDRSWLILDPRTYQLLGGGMQGAVTGKDGKPDISSGGKESSTAVVTAQWTDQHPAAPRGR
ncbi:CU044_5270 family protein [Actinoplanes sp. URMC 104]|uniref:CU044_5270 family protein n=1 Tax=Actinoplanes sp. URMC 104 TaxID=3423409 RepID=UPI003F1DF47D